MIKSKLKVWVWLILICLFITNLPNIYSVVKDKITEYNEMNEIRQTLSINIDTNDVTMKNRLSGEALRVDDFYTSIVISSDNPDVIITKQNIEKDGYEKLEKFLYVPYVMISNPYLPSRNNCFSSLGDYTYSKNMIYILEAIEKDMTWKDIGLDDENTVKKDERVSLTIPDERTEAYKNIRTYFMYVLNGYKEPTEENSAELMTRVNNILSKCEKVENIPTMFKQKSWFKVILFCPESVIANAGESFNKCIEIVPEKTIRDEYNVYVKPEKLEIAKGVFKNPTFLYKTGFRNKEYNDLENAERYIRTAEVFDFVDITNDIEWTSTVQNTNTQSQETVEAESTEETKETVEEPQDDESVTDEMSGAAAEENVEETNADEESDEGGVDFITVFIIVVLVIVMVAFLLVILVM